MCRLVPLQDYHRFHLPVSGTLRSIRQVNGKLYTVNPIAVASTYANVFTQVQSSQQRSMACSLFVFHKKRAHQAQNEQGKKLLRWCTFSTPSRWYAQVGIARGPADALMVPHAAEQAGGCDAGQPALWPRRHHRHWRYHGALCSDYHNHHRRLY